MSTVTENVPEVSRPSSGARLGRGLKYSIVGPLLILRGVLGLGVGSTVGTARWVGRRCHRGEDAAGDLAVVVQTGSKRRRPLLIAGVTVAVLALGGITFSIVRRSMQPEPSPLPPSVDVTPQP
ncbi:cell wall synthesis protein CwsA [Mycolicibacterium aubagnense]|uniref:Cell wall synthesis protein CwsA n=1 Tax=Mycolicibacterium aubagnense TaxID=319707 RepID=A0ABM7IFP7_9MYCO|nr:cell wall synthesis protein CwsA [Mycolicibacterium aubagnense]TLH57017.1 cell wall synthesis protein CwsA [Mycolicibacterium aubagnense]WGI32822.1 cell wall synthesis protein CwsA [Mycolicibacterium aubagnense]BBX85516.1 cell wall synthesis protein CwsA [Mycolicibacterium aubagnense]